MVYTLVELYSIYVYINQPDGKKGCEVYGKIHAEAGGRIIELFNLKKDNSISIASDGSIPLASVPSRCMICPNFDVSLSLYEKNHDLEISRGFLSFTVNIEPEVYEIFNCFIVYGKDGCAVVNMSIFENAVQAVVQIAIIRDEYDQNTTTCSALYGAIFAGNSNYQHLYESWYISKYYRTPLFDVVQEEAVVLQPGNKKLPLSRYVVAVPIKSSLIIQADLWDNPAKVASNSAAFEAQRSGTCSQRIHGPDGCIEVKVTWFDQPLAVTEHGELLETCQTK